MKTVKILLLIVIIFLVGTTGYVIIEGWSLFDAFYMTAISITTVGFGETKPLSQAGKIFTITIIFMGLGAAAVFATHLARVFLESHFKNLFGANKMLKKINRLKNHYIVCGYGGVGSSICNSLYEAGIKFVVIEENQDVAQWAHKRDFMTVVGKATYDTTLIQAGIKDASGIVVSMGEDSLNMYVSLAARELNSDIYIIARGYKSDIESRLIRAGADRVVYPIKMGGEQIAELVMKQLQVRNHKNINMGYQLHPYKHYSDQVTTVGEVIKRMQTHSVITLKRVSGEKIPNPPEELAVQKGDTLLLVVEEDRHKEFILDDKYLLHFPAIDSDHKELFNIYNRFIENLKNSEANESIIKSFDRVIDRTTKHFETEEKLMKLHKYRGLRSHSRAHKNILSTIKDLNADSEYSFDLGSEEVLLSSLMEHILREDLKFVNFVKEA